MYIQERFTDYLSFESRGITYKVNEEKGIVTAIAEFNTPLYLKDIVDGHSFTTVGIARVNKDAGDIFDVEKGKRLARAKAEKEAYVKFKLILLKYKEGLSQMSNALEKALDKMKAQIQNQRSYIENHF